MKKGILKTSRSGIQERQSFNFDGNRKVTYGQSRLIRTSLRPRVASVSSATSGASDSESSVEVLVIKKGHQFIKSDNNNGSVSSAECVTSDEEQLKQQELGKAGVSFQQDVPNLKKKQFSYDDKTFNLGEETVLHIFDYEIFPKEDNIPTQIRESTLIKTRQSNSNRQISLQNSVMEEVKIEEQQTNVICDDNYFSNLRTKFEKEFSVKETKKQIEKAIKPDEDDVDRSVVNSNTTKQIGFQNTKLVKAESNVTFVESQASTSSQKKKKSRFRSLFRKKYSSTN